jgi:two-component system chemotaxis sensor kinase CheA
MQKISDEALGLLNFLVKGKDPTEDLIIRELEGYLPFLKKDGDRRKEPLIDRRKPTLPPQPAQVVAAEKAVDVRAGEKVIKVAQEKIDVFMNLIGELLVSKNNLNDLAREISIRYNIPEVANRVKEAAESITRISDELQNNIMEIRMLPVSNAFSRFPRMIRDLAKKLNKKIRLEIRGEETELDKNIIEALNDPLVHLVRNSADHGIELPEERAAKGKAEEGLVQLNAFNQGQYVVIQIIDDGKGIDPARIRNKALERGLLPESELEKLDNSDVLNLIFLPGFSLAKEITDVSGRGVGMDVVKSNIEKLGGEVLIESELDKGSTITLKLPLTLAIGRGLEVEAHRNRYYIPLEYIVETIKVPRENIYLYKGRMMSVIRNEIMPVYFLEERLGYGKNGRNCDSEAMVILNIRNQKIGMVVDNFFNESEYVIKPLTQALGNIEGVTGAMITGEGKVHLILDPVKLI